MSESLVKASSITTELNSYSIIHHLKFHSTWKIHQLLHQNCQYIPVQLISKRLLNTRTRLVLKHVQPKITALTSSDLLYVSWPLHTSGWDVSWRLFVTWGIAHRGWRASNPRRIQIQWCRWFGIRTAGLLSLLVTQDLRYSNLLLKNLSVIIIRRFPIDETGTLFTYFSCTALALDGWNVSEWEPSLSSGCVIHCLILGTRPSLWHYRI